MNDHEAFFGKYTKDDQYAFFHLLKGSMGTTLGMIIGRYALIEDDGEFEARVTSECEGVMEQMLIQGGPTVTKEAELYVRRFTKNMIDKKYEVRAEVRSISAKLKGCDDIKEVINRSLDGVKRNKQ